VASGTPEMTRKTLSPVGFICSVHTALPEYNSPPFSSSSRFSCRAPTSRAALAVSLLCHPERSEGSAFRKSPRKKQIPHPVQKANGVRNDNCPFSSQSVQSCLPAGLKPHTYNRTVARTAFVSRARMGMSARRSSPLRHSERSEESLFFSAERPPWQTPSRAQERECRRADNCT